MDKILNWNQPEKIRSSEEHNAAYVSDSGIPGTFVPNMSDEDRFAYKAKYVGGNVPRIEIRVSRGAEILVKLKNKIVKEPELWDHSSWKAIYDQGRKNVKISMNGAAEFTWEEWEEFKKAIEEGFWKLKKKEALSDYEAECTIMDAIHQNGYT